MLTSLCIPKKKIYKYGKNQNEFIRERIHDFEPLSDRVQDDILTVSAQLEQVDLQKQTNNHQTIVVAAIQIKTTDRPNSQINDQPSNWPTKQPRNKNVYKPTF